MTPTLQLVKRRYASKPGDVTWLIGYAEQLEKQVADRQVYIDRLSVVLSENHHLRIAMQGCTCGKNED